MTTACINEMLHKNIEAVKNEPKTPKNIDWRDFNPDKDLVPFMVLMMNYRFDQTSI